MKKVLFISNNLGQGGKERQIHELLKYFNENTNFEFALLLREPIINYDLKNLKTITTFIPEKRLGAFDFFLFSLRTMRLFKPNILHTWESGSALIALFAKKIFFLNIGVVDGTLRYSKKFPKTSKLYWVARIARAFSNKVVGNSHAGINSLDYKSDGKFLVIPNGIDFKRFDLYSKKQQDKSVIVIGMVASFTKPKDYKTLVSSCIDLLQQKHNIKIVLIGDGPERIGIENSIPQNLKDKFEFTGNIKQPELIIAELDIAVLLSKKQHSEGLSNSIMEYMVAGLPVICTNTGGNPELIKENENGFLIEHENSEQLKSRLLELINSAALRKKMGERSFELASTNFDIKKVAEKYISLYQSI